VRADSAAYGQFQRAETETVSELCHSLWMGQVEVATLNESPTFRLSLCFTCFYLEFMRMLASFSLVFEL